MNNVASHFKWTAVGKFAAQMISWSSTIIVIRFLTPEDYGLVALATILIGFATLVGELGLTSAIIQDKTVNEQKIQNTQGLIGAVYILLTALCIIGAPYFSSYYNAPELANIVVVLSTQFLLLALTSVDFALLRKKLDFKGVALIQMFANTMGAITTLLCAALFNLGVWSIVLGTLTIFAFNALGYRLRTKRKFAWNIDIRNSLEYLKFGGSMSLQRFFSYINSQASSVIIGKSFGPEQLGILSISRELSSLIAEKITPIFSSVMFPLYSKMESTDEQANVFYTCVKVLYVIILPSSWGIGLTAEHLVPIVLGEAWIQIVPYLQILALWAPVNFICFTYSPIMYALGDKKTPLYNTAILTTLNLTSILIGINWGIYGICITLGVSSVIYTIYATYSFSHSTKIKKIGIIKALSPPTIASLVMSTLVYLANTHLNLSHLEALIILTTLGVISYIAITYITDKNIFTETKRFIKG